MFLIFLRHILDVPFYHPACQPTYLSIYQLIYQPVNLPVCWPTYPSVWLSFCPRKRNNFLGVVYYGLNLLFNEKKSCRDIAELLTWLKSVARKHFNHLCVHVHTHAHIHIHTQHPHTLHTHTYTPSILLHYTHTLMHTYIHIQHPHTLHTHACTHTVLHLLAWTLLLPWGLMTADLGQIISNVQNNVKHSW